MTQGDKCDHGYSTQEVKDADGWRVLVAPDCPICTGPVSLPYR